MKYKAITIEGASGDIEIRSTPTGACVLEGEECIAAFDRAETHEERHPKERLVALAVYGADRKGRINATVSMIADVAEAIARVAGF